MRPLAHPRILIAVLGVAIWSTPTNSHAQEGGAGYSAILDNIDLLIDNYCRFVGRQYNLDEEQYAYTQQMLRDRAYKFLDRNDETLRRLVDRMFDVRTGGEMSQKDLVSWGMAAKPLYDEAKALIIDGNVEWREILNEEQRRIHDEVLVQMYESFETTEAQLELIVSGQMTVEEFRNPRRAAQNARSRAAAGRTVRPRPQTAVAPPQQQIDEPVPPDEVPPDPEAEAQMRAARGERPSRIQPGAGNIQRLDRPRQPPTHEEFPPDAPPPPDIGPQPGAPPAPGARGGRRPGGVRNTEDFASQWEQYVRTFIQRFGLNDEQQQQAMSILQDCQNQGERHMKGRKAEIERLDARLAEIRASRDRSAASEVSELNTQRQKLLEPIEQIFEKSLKPRLERIPTRAQRRAAEAAARQPRNQAAGQKP